jgi:phage tail tape-measure protein
MALKFAMIVEMVNRLSRPGREARRDTRELGKSMRELGRAGNVASRGMDRAARSANGMRNRLGVRLLARVRQLAGPMGLKAIEKAGYGAGRAIGFTIKKIGGLVVRGAQLTAALAGLASGAFFGGIISTTAKFEQFQIMLEGIEGSATKAKQSMDWVRKFAKTTPYELDQVMEAFVQLKAYGIDPIDGALAAAGDAAAGMSKPLMQAIEALADAQTGEFERLKEFGIRASVQGNKVAFTYMKNGKEIRKETTKNAAAMKDAITGIWSERFGGMMDRQSRTFSGMISNLKDGWTDFMLRVGQAGVFDKVKVKLQGVVDWLNKKLDDGSIDRWAKMASDRLGEVVDKIKGIDDADVGNFLGDLGAIAKACVDIISALGKIHTLIMKIDGAWGSVDKWTDRWMIGGSGWGDLVRGGPPAPKGKVAPQATRDNMWRKALAPSVAPRAPARGVRTQSINPAFLRTPAAQKVPVGGSLTVNVKADPGLVARPGKMTTANSAVPLVYRGGAMVSRG